MGWEDFTKYLNLVNNCDPNDPLITDTPLGDRLSEIPLASVYQPGFLKLFQNLNIEQLVPTNTGLRRDYRGLAELMGFTIAEIETFFKRSYNPIKSLIDEFLRRNPNIDINKLLKYVEKIERFDIIDDMIPDLIRLASGNRIVTYPHDNYNAKRYHSTKSGNDELRDTFDRLTIDDTADTIETYDAFICYAPEDSRHAVELIEFLTANGIKVATAEDLLPGNFEHDAMVKLIDSRCRKVIIVLTPNFSQSKECEFQTKFASELGFKSSGPKIIPVIYEACPFHELPRLIEVSTKIDMTNKATRTWKERMLIRSLLPDAKDTFQRRQPEVLRLSPTIQSISVDSSNNRTGPTITPISGPISRSIETESDPLVEVMLSNTSVGKDASPAIQNSESRISSGEGSSTTIGGLGYSRSKTWLNGLRSVTRKVLRSDQTGTNSQMSLLSSTYSEDGNPS